MLGLLFRFRLDFAIEAIRSIGRSEGMMTRKVDYAEARPSIVSFTVIERK